MTTSTTNDTMVVNKVVIPCAGRGTRLLPLTKVVPKVLLPLGAKPVLQHVVDYVKICGLRTIIFVVSPEQNSIRDYFGSSDGEVEFLYELQEEQHGLADAIYCAKDSVDGEHFAVVLGDTIIYSDTSDKPMRRVIQAYQKHECSAAVLVEKVPSQDVYRYGIVQPLGNPGYVFEISDLVEKPKVGEAPSQYAIGGTYVFDPCVFKFIERTFSGAGGETQITDTIALMLAEGRRVFCATVAEYERRIDIGTFDSYFEAFTIEIDRMKTAT